MDTPQWDYPANWYQLPERQPENETVCAFAGCRTRLRNYGVPICDEHEAAQEALIDLTVDVEKGVKTDWPKGNPHGFKHHIDGMLTREETSRPHWIASVKAVLCVYNTIHRTRYRFY